MPDPAGTLIFSGLERAAGWRRVSQDGLLLGTVPGTPVDPFAPGCAAMGGLADGKIWIAASAYFWTMDPDYSGLDGEVAFVYYTNGSNGTSVYKIALVPPDFSTAVLTEIDPSDWSTTRTWNLPGFGGDNVARIGFANLTVNADASIAYYTADLNPTTGAFETYTIVHRYDLDNDVPLSDFATGTGGAGGLLPLPNGDVIVGWSTPGVCTRYDSDGNVVRTYAQPAYSYLQSILSLGVNNSFWVIGEASSGSVDSTMYEFDLDTGDELHSFDNPSDGYIWTSPFTVLGGDVAPTVGSIVVEKVTDPPSDPQVFSFTTTNLSPSTFTLIDGATRTFSGLTPGAGYGISEDVVANWGTEYSVSNDSPHDNISVGSGETVTVTVSNTFAGDCIQTAYGIRILRRAPHLSTEQLLRFHRRFTLDIEAGLGLRDAPATSPIIDVRWSDDGGHTWGNYYPMSAGAEGQYSKRLFRNRLGKSRDRIYEVSSADDAFWNIMAAFLETELGSR